MGGFPASEVIAALIADRLKNELILLGKAQRTCSVNG